MQNKYAKSIAVLPFVNMSSSEENEYFSDGMTEEIINALAKIKNLKVTSRTSSFFFKNKNIPITKIGKELNVSTVLEGSIRLAGSKVRITAQLIDVADDFHFWSETFDRSMDNIFEVQDEVSLLIADKLREHIGHFELENQLVHHPNISVDVYQKYLKGRFYLMKLNLPDTEKSIAIFKEVTEEAPDFPLAYLDINQGYAFLGTMGLLPAHESYMKAKPYLDKAIELNENLPETRLNLAWINCWQNWSLEDAYKHVLKSIEIRPSDSSYLTMSNLLTIEGKFEAAHNYIEKAIQLDPFSGMNTHYKGFLYFLEEKYEKAIPFFEKALRMNPGLPYPNLYIGQSLILSGKPQQGLTFFKNLPDDEGGELTKLGGTTLAYTAMNDSINAEKCIAKLKTAMQTDSEGRALNFLILVYATMGQHETALNLIEKCITNRMPLTLLLPTEPFLKPLRSNNRFQELMKKILGKQTDFGLSKRKYKKSLFNEELRKQYQQLLEQLMTEQRPYLDPGLTLRGLAAILDIPTNHLSQLLNESFDKNFSEFINSYRLDAFKNKVMNPQFQHMTLLAIAYESGFNSKTVFNTFFKKKEGKTPKAYWREVVK